MWLESELHTTRGSTDILLATLEDGIEFLTIAGHYVLDIRYILQSSFNLERGSTGIEQLFQFLALIQVLQRKQVLVLDDGLAIGIHQIERQSAELGTFTSVRTSSEAMLTHIALTAIAHAQSTMHEDFEWSLWYRLVYLTDLFQREFACQNHLSETCLSQEFYLRGTAVVHLCAGMERYRW